MQKGNFYFNESTSFVITDVQWLADVLELLSVAGLSLNLADLKHMLRKTLSSDKDVFVFFVSSNYFTSNIRNFQLFFVFLCRSTIASASSISSSLSK